MIKTLTKTSTLHALILLAACAPGHSQIAGKHALVIEVSPQGDDDDNGTSEHSFRTLERAQKAVRLANKVQDVVVELATGTYRLSKTLLFSAGDGGQSEHTVSWQAADGAQPVISGAMAVTGWKLVDAKRHIFAADVPAGSATRQLWVNDVLVPMAFVELQRKNISFTRQGLTVHGTDALLSELHHAKHMELRATGFFTERFSPVERIDGNDIIMRQPAWDNNLWGYDTVEKPFHPELQHLYLANALPLINAPGQWYLDTDTHTLYLCPPNGVDLSQADVEMPRLEVLLSIGDSLRTPVHDLSFRGIRFSHTTWMGPSSNEGYASQQSGSYLAGRAAAYPADPIGSCAQGCEAFESMRNEWRQMPASIQVSAAESIRFEHNIFAHLGQYALGIGNDADAMMSGQGLGTSDVTIFANVFMDCAGGAILAGGVQREAHHPSDPRLINRQLVIRSNRIYSVSRDYRDNTAILSTYVAGAVILHNDISDIPYDAIDIGYGWGIEDPGGNPNYRVRMHGYDWPQNLVYAAPTTHHDVVVAANRIHDAKKLFEDGGAIYNLSASPGTLITENYIFDNHGQIGIYLDEGSRYITVRKNVVNDDKSEWLNINTIRADYPIRISFDNTAIDNWHNSSKTGGMWTNYQNNLILDNHLVLNDKWSDEAREIMTNSGVESSAGTVSYGVAK